MNKIVEKTKKESSFIHIHSKKKQVVDAAQYEQLKKAPIQNLICPDIKKKIFGGFVLKYDVSAYTPLVKYLRAPLNNQPIGVLFGQVADFLRNIESQNIAIQQIVFSIQYAQVNTSTNTVSFLYMPISNCDNPSSVRHFFAGFINQQASMPIENAEYIRLFWENLNRNSDYTADGITESIKSTDLQIPEIKTITPLVNPNEYNPMASGKAASDAEPPQPEGAGNRTVILGQGTPGRPAKRATGRKAPYLLHEAADKKIPIESASFKIGKDPSQADYVINGNNKISRVHAVIQTEGKKYFITDLNSTNRTFVNKQAIPPGVKTEISPGASIRLADERFTFDITN